MRSGRFLTFRRTMMRMTPLGNVITRLFFILVAVGGGRGLRGGRLTGLAWLVETEKSHCLIRTGSREEQPREG